MGNPSHLAPVTLESQSAMTVSNDMATMIGFGCEAVLYGAFPASTGKTSQLLISL